MFFSGAAPVRSPGPVSRDPSSGALKYKYTDPETGRTWEGWEGASYAHTVHSFMPSGTGAWFTPDSGAPVAASRSASGPALRDPSMRYGAAVPTGGQILDLHSMASQRELERQIQSLERYPVYPAGDIAPVSAMQPPMPTMAAPQAVAMEEAVTAPEPQQVVVQTAAPEKKKDIPFKWIAAAAVVGIALVAMRR